MIYNNIMFVNNFFMSDNRHKEVAMIRIEEARNMNGLSQAQLAAKIGTFSPWRLETEKAPASDTRAS